MVEGARLEVVFGQKPTGVRISLSPKRTFTVAPFDIYKPAEMLVFYFTARLAIKDGTFKK